MALFFIWENYGGSIVVLIVACSDQSFVRFRLSICWPFFVRVRSSRMSNIWPFFLLLPKDPAVHPTRKKGYERLRPLIHTGKVSDRLLPQKKDPTVDPYGKCTTVSFINGYYNVRPLVDKIDWVLSGWRVVGAIFPGQFRAETSSWGGTAVCVLPGHLWERYLHTSTYMHAYIHTCLLYTSPSPRD